MTAPRIVGIDLSLTATGLAHHRVQTVTIRPTTDGIARLFEVRGRVSAYIRGADLVVIEGYSYASRHHAHQLGELGGAVRMMLHYLDVPWVDVAPATLKKYATGKGNAGKDDMLAEAIRRLGYDGADHNQADALWLREMGRSYYGHPDAVGLPAKHREALDTIDWPDIGTAP